MLDLALREGDDEDAGIPGERHRHRRARQGGDGGEDIGLVGGDVGLEHHGRGGGHDQVEGNRRANGPGQRGGGTGRPGVADATGVGLDGRRAGGEDVDPQSGEPPEAEAGDDHAGRGVEGERAAGADGDAADVGVEPEPDARGVGGDDAVVEGFDGDRPGEDVGLVGRRHGRSPRSKRGPRR